MKTIVKALFVLSLLALTACASTVQAEAESRPGVVQQAVTTGIDVLKAKTEMLAYLTSENCTIDDELRGTLGLSVGDQFRLTKADNSSIYGLVTIHSDYEDGSDNDDIRMRLSGRQRFNTSDSFSAYAEAWTPLHGKTDTWLNSNDEFGEFLDETSTTHSKVVFCAPHGGMVENYTDEMAQWAYNRVAAASKEASAWYCIGHQDTIGAYDAWHITSTDISRNSFPYLNDIGDRAFDHAVSFHGYGEADIAIGGNASSTVKNEVKQAIEGVVGNDYDVVIVTSGSYSGTSASNFVNWLTDGGTGGVQVEIPSGARSSYGQAIAEAVADVFIAKQ